jgi:hypothetical protein
MLTDISLLKTCPNFFSSFVRILEFTCDSRLIKIFMDLSKVVPSVYSNEFLSLPMKPIFSTFFKSRESKKLIGLGQLQQKEEAAGKMRTFAMVDS